jgi:uncharacterized Zn finger protein
MQTMIEIKRNDAMNRAIARAKHERPKVKPVSVSERVYTVTGSKGDTYTVRFAVSGNKKLASCDCKGGQAGMVCKHVAAAAAVNIGLQRMRRAAEQSAAEVVKVETRRVQNWSANRGAEVIEHKRVTVSDARGVKSIRGEIRRKPLPESSCLQGRKINWVGVNNAGAGR